MTYSPHDPRRERGRAVPPDPASYEPTAEERAAYLRERNTEWIAGRFGLNDRAAAAELAERLLWQRWLYQCGKVQP